MPSQNQNGRNSPGSDDRQRSGYRPQDQTMRDERDDDRSMIDRDRGRRDPQDEGYRPAERYGQGQSVYAGGRYGEDRSLAGQVERAMERSGYSQTGGFSQGYTPGGYGQQQGGPHRGKGPQGWQRSDERIRDVICELLTDDDQIDATNIEIRVTGGEVFLIGTVPDRQTKRMTEDVVERVSGVKDIQNQLKVGKHRA